MMKMPYKDRQKQREYQREWTRRKRKKLPTAWKPRKAMSIEEQKLRANKHKKEVRKTLQKIRDEIWGTKCFFCPRTKNLVLHKKSGEKHHSRTVDVKEAVKEPEKWVRLCRVCHTGVHFCMKFLGLTWDEII